MRTITIRLTVASALSIFPVLLVAAPPTPPVKPGLWQVKMTSLDANGKEMPAPEQAAMARMTPEVRARMAEMMKARGMVMPDESGAMKVCLTKETFDSGGWQQATAQSGCTTNYLTTTGSLWKWHSSCTSIKSETDGEVVFNSAENYRTKVTTTSTVMNQTRTTTRVVQSNWLGGDCGDIKPVTANSLAGRGQQPR